MDKFFHVKDGINKNSFISVNDVEAAFPYYENGYVWLYVVLHSGKEISIWEGKQSDKPDLAAIFEDFIRGRK